MKQKRKVKALSSSNDCRTFNGNNLITSLLLVLGGVLLLGSISLFSTHGVVEAATKLNAQFYTGVTNKTETIYGVTFIKSGSNDVVGDMYVDKGSNGPDFYITADSLVASEVQNGSIRLSSDKVGQSTASSVLGGNIGKKTESSTALRSSNITLIGGSESNISMGNDNAALLGGSEIEIGEGSSYAPSAVIGGSKNKMEGDQNGNSLVGGSSNTIGSNSTNVHILGGQNNVVAGDNVIVAGEGVRVDSDVNNVFAFSADSGQFKPKSSNAFYLDIAAGLGLDKDTEDGKVSSNGAVSMGELSSDDLNGCKRDDRDSFLLGENVGVQGTIEGCVVGCTSRSIQDSRWELLDKSDYCIDVCESTYNCNIYPDTDGIKGGGDHDNAYCTGIDVKDSWWSGRVSQCGGDWAERNYQDVVFKTEIIDVDGTCPGDMTPKGENQCVFKCNAGYHLVDGMCYKDCTRDGRTIKHKESDYWNPNTTETCPTECEDTKVLLTCQDGTLYNGSSVDTTHTVYQSNCTTQPLPSPEDYNRSSAVSYANCSSFQPYEVNNNACKALPKTYKCTNCNNHYTLNSSNLDILPNGDTSAQCLQDCSFPAGPSRNTIYLSGWTGSPNSSIVAYKSGLYVCPVIGTSESEVRQCNNGTLSGTYTYISYTQNGVQCNDVNEGLTRTVNDTISNATLVSPSYCVEYQDDTCNVGDTKYYYQCDDTYGWNPAGTKCVKCTGNPPNAVRNNNSMPDDTMPLYYDNVNTSDPCTFRCADGAYYDESLGICVGYTCDGVEHGESRTLTLDKTPLCPTECDEVEATCYSGVWYNSNGVALTNYSLGTCTTSSKTCTIENSGSLKWFSSSDGSKYPASLGTECTEYSSSSSGKGCTEGTTYKSRLCEGTNYWSGDYCEPVCVNNACASGFRAYGTAASTSYTCTKGRSNIVSCICGAGKKWSTTAEACVNGVSESTCDLSGINKCNNGTATNKEESNTAYTWDCKDEFGDITAKCAIYKCTGTTGAHTVVNNGDYPTSSTGWHYSTDTSEVCSYRCEDGYDWVKNDYSGEYECKDVDHYEWRFSKDKIEKEYESTDRSAGGCFPGWPWKPNSDGTIRAQVNAMYLTKNSQYKSRDYAFTNYTTGRNETEYWNNCNNRELSEENTDTKDVLTERFPYSTTNVGDYGIKATMWFAQFELGFYAIDQSATSLSTVPGIEYNTKWGYERLITDYGTTPTMTWYDANDYKGESISVSVGAFPVYIHIDWSYLYDILSDPPHKNDRHAHGGANIIGSLSATSTPIYYARCGEDKHGSTKTQNSCTYKCNDGSWVQQGTCSNTSNQGGGTTSSCFIAGTKVTMADGSKKNIEDIEVGDLLLGETSINEVEELYRPLLGEQKLFSINGGKNFVTAEHPFKTTRGWRSMDPVSSMKLMDGQVDLLKVGDILITENGYEKITSLVGTSASKDTQLYNFKVGGDDTYYADGYLVHNKGCFLAGTQVYMADGTTKNIEDVEAGDMVMTYNTASQNIEYHRVLRPLVHENNNDELYELTINGDVLKVTEVHRFYVTRDGGENVDNQCANPYEWIEARYLKVGDKILMNDGTLAEIEDITHHSNYGTVYNLWVEGMHNYYVDKGYLVHNSSKDKATTDLDDGPGSSNNDSDCGGPGKPECTTEML